jgi:hypothetical protein
MKGCLLKLLETVGRWRSRERKKLEVIEVERVKEADCCRSWEC